jgi:hypothetical protein
MEESADPTTMMKDRQHPSPSSSIVASSFLRLVYFSPD